MNDSKLDISQSGVTTLPMFIGATTFAAALGLCLIAQTIVDGTTMVYGVEGKNRWPSEWFMLFSKPWLSFALGAIAGLAFGAGVQRFDERRSDFLACWLDEILNGASSRRPFRETILLTGIGAVFVIVGGILAPVLFKTSPYIFLFSFAAFDNVVEYRAKRKRAQRTTAAIDSLNLSDEKLANGRAWVETARKKSRPGAYFALILILAVAAASVVYSLSLRRYFHDLDLRHIQMLESASRSHPVNTPNLPHP